MKCYIKIKDHLYYEISKGCVISINTQSQTIKRVKTIPTAYVENIDVITEKEFINAKNQIGL